ncbi:MAG: chorismate mutase [Rhizomicrobium sp.]
MTRKSTPPQACHSLKELRKAIDALDSKLVAMLALRQAYVERAAVLKASRAAVHDEGRIEEVVKKVMAEGRRAGLSALIAEKVWRALIAASIEHEYQAFDGKAGRREI